MVASEVRSLAGRSAGQPRNQVTDQTSVERWVRSQPGPACRADHGGNREFGARVSQTINAITAAVSEQSDGIGEINTAVGQLDQMTQQNAALVEQSAAAASSLQDQAQRLAQAVGVFRLQDDRGSTWRNRQPSGLFEESGLSPAKHGDIAAVFIANARRRARTPLAKVSAPQQCPQRRAAVRNALPVNQRLPRLDGLVARDEMTLQHHADDGTLPLCELRGHILGHSGWRS